MNPPNLQKYPSLTSINSFFSTAGLPPGHGFVPKKVKPEKPYGLSFIDRMNRTHRGPGKKYLQYALVCVIAAVLFFSGAALYLGHRTVSRMIVYRTEVFGPLMCVAGLVCVSLATNFAVKARAESNRWRANIRFRPEGLATVAAVNEAYVPDESEKLMTGTYGPKALKEIPKPRPPGYKNRSRQNLRNVGGGGGGPPRPIQGQEMRPVQQIGGPETGHLQPPTYRQAPNAGYQQPNVGYQQPNVGYQQPNVGYQQPNVGYQQPNVGYQQPNVGYQQPFQKGGNQWGHPQSAQGRPGHAMMTPQPRYPLIQDQAGDPRSRFISEQRPGFPMTDFQAQGESEL